MLYLIIIGVAIVLITVANLLFSLPVTTTDALMMLLSVTLGAVAAFAIDGMSALIIRRLTPKKWYADGKRIFTVSKREKNFYCKLRIKEWKDKIPELGGFTSFHKDKLESVSDADYLRRFILEANFGVVIHIANALLGALVAFVPLCHSPLVWIPVFAVNFVLSLLPVAVLRYTSYYLLRMLKRSEARSRDAEGAEDTRDANLQEPF